MLTVTLKVKVSPDDLLEELFADGELINAYSYHLVDIHYNKRTKEVIIEAESND